MGKAKYEKLGMDYALKDVKPLGRDEALDARQTILRGIRDAREKEG